jgi:Protein-arginine deiminase (PAD)/Protein-arginine deiminase (PAD) middle domain
MEAIVRAAILVVPCLRSRWLTTLNSLAILTVLSSPSILLSSGTVSAQDTGAQLSSAYKLIAPSLVAQGESFTGTVVKEAPDGDQPLASGDMVVFNGQVVPHEHGQIELPAFHQQQGNYFISLLVTSGGGAGAVLNVARPQHVEIVPLQAGWRTASRDPVIQRVSSVANDRTRFKVYGNNLDRLSDAALVSKDGRKTVLGKPLAASRFEQIYSPPKNLPEGQLNFVASSADGKTYSAPQPCYNPGLQITGPQIAHRGQTGNFTVSIDASTFPPEASSRVFHVNVTGGGAQIQLEKHEVDVSRNQPGQIPFTAKQIGNFQLNVVAVNPEDREVSPDAPRVNAKQGPVGANYDARSGTTNVSVPVDITNTSGQPVPNARVQGMISHPGGVQHVAAVTDASGHAQFSSSIPGQVVAADVVASVATVPGTVWKPPACHMQHSIWPKTGILADAVSPPAGSKRYKTPEPVPLIVQGSAADEFIQTCLCENGAASKQIDIADRVLYEWAQLSGKGRLEGGGGPATLYHPPDLKVGESDTGRLQVVIKDANGRDAPATVTFTVTTTRPEDCEYKRTVTIDKKILPASPPTITPGVCKCVPLPEEWIPTPPLDGETPGKLKVCAGQKVLVGAQAKDDDTLNLKCGGECGFVTDNVLLTDETVYTWSADRGGFLAPVTNSRNTSAIYQAPDKGGPDTIHVVIRDSGIQARDRDVIKTIPVSVRTVTLTVEKLPEEKNKCPGGVLFVNNDDDDKDGTSDRDERRVPGEHDLLRVTISEEPREDDVTFSCRIGCDRIKAWDTPEKGTEIKLPKVYPPSELPKVVWIEAIKQSDSDRDIELVASLDGASSAPTVTAFERVGAHDRERSPLQLAAFYPPMPLEDPAPGGPGCQDKAALHAVEVEVLVDTNRDGKVDEKGDEKDRALPVDYMNKWGALVLANLDDDDSTPKGETDAKDDKITSANDFDDLSELVVKPMKLPNNGNGWSAYLKWDAVKDGKIEENSGSDHLRLFKERKVGEQQCVYKNPKPEKPEEATYAGACDMTLAEMQNGHTYYMEGMTPGTELEIVLHVESPAGEKTDKVRVLTTPVIFLPNTSETERVFYSDWTKNPTFVNELKAASAKAKVPAEAILAGIHGIAQGGGGFFAEDIFQIGYQRLPVGTDGKPVTMPLAVKLPWAAFAGAKTWPKDHLLTRDFGYYEVEDKDDAANYGGNIETIPPTDPALPYGRLAIGNNMGDKLRQFLIEQKVQTKDKKLLELPLRNSAFEHIDEIISVVPVKDKFKIVIADPGLGVTMLIDSAKDPKYKELQDLRKAYQTKSSKDSVDDAKKRLAETKDLLKKELGLADGIFIAVPIVPPVPDHDGFGLPDSVNLQVVGSYIVVPSPIYDRKSKVFEPFRQKIVDNMKAGGVDVEKISFINTAAEVSGLKGEVHCATNSQRTPPK